MKAIFLGLSFIAIAIFGYYFWFAWDNSKNRGYTYGYFGDFNRTKTYLSSVEGVEIVDDWYNPDMLLEEFGFVVIYKGDKIRLFFGEEDEARNMSEPDAIVELAKRVEAGDSPFYE